VSERALSDARRRVVDHLKLQAPARPRELAEALGLTEAAVRQHLQALEAAGLALPAKTSTGARGRPSMAWSLTAEADALFPDRHGELTVGILEAPRSALGEKGLEKVVAARTRQQVELYRSVVPRTGSLRSRVEALAEQRTREGYMAEVVQEKRGQFLLMEHHCPICEAARSCLGLCSSELEVFERVLGEDAHLERTEHLLSGARRCVYRIRKAGS